MQARLVGCDGLVQHAYNRAAPHLLDVAHRLLFDGGQAAADVALVGCEPSRSTPLLLTSAW